MNRELWEDVRDYVRTLDKVNYTATEELCKALVSMVCSWCTLRGLGSTGYHTGYIDALLDIILDHPEPGGHASDTFVRNKKLLFDYVVRLHDSLE
jgi:hypothetical protein